ncbi:hypothetical protein TrCOL_g5091 [Triparma columacea]|uniref:Secreted protein n=1 Tax=Triparma columacea TaxID=722753 RepID=A0A9W7GDB8_9STRA|nr:hypothetical protein TrCOL_g5091 [Triparma columacea]
MKLLLSLLSLVPPTLGFANFGCAGPCCLSDGSYLSNSETECVLSNMTGTQSNLITPSRSYCKINEVKNTPWYNMPNHCPDGATYGEEYNHLGECKQDERKFIAAEQIPFC